MTLLWRFLALVCIALGIVGLVLPIVPTVPFLLLAAAAANRGWPWLDERLVNHPLYGPSIVRWRERRVIPRNAKWFATLGMTGSCIMVAFAPVPDWLKFALPAVMAAIAAWIWARPER